MDNAEVLIPITFSLALFGAIAWISTARARTRQVMAKSQAEVHTRMIDKFGSAREFVDFVQSPNGKEFLAGSTEQLKIGPREKILGSIRHAMIWISLGIGMFIISRSQDVDMRGFSVAGTILIALGIGFLLSSIVSLRLSKAWGLLPEKDSAPDPTAR